METSTARLASSERASDLQTEEDERKLAMYVQRWSLQLADAGGGDTHPSRRALSQAILQLKRRREAILQAGVALEKLAVTPGVDITAPAEKDKPTDTEIPSPDQTGRRCAHIRSR